MNKRNRRNKDPSTSHISARSISQIDLIKVYQMFYVHVRLADFQLEELLGGSMNGKWRKRRSDLTADGLVKDSGKKIMNPHTGHNVIVWELTKKQLDLFDHNRRD